ncbi:hypothetical protein [Plantibacter sp. CFBP 8804]|uniref:hypothetical protein n=1 Tax=Plantibacter sp. CFBP 8804 TaxID=2775270 RepID=UPI001781536B|nr:hypothetical protein [Plantibacter sp. CFBP 8804]MBD8518912.1 hypothetical protein [Plantibacter sp. CFBP 8804]
MPTISSSRTFSTLALAVGLLALTACTEVEPAPAPSRTPPVFENEEQALAAVTETVGSFVTVVNTIGAEGGQNPERLDHLLAPDLKEAETAGFVDMAAKGWRTTGEATLRRVELAQWWPRPDAVGVIAVAQACIDYTGVDVLDSGGTSVVNPERDQLRSTELQLTAADGDVLISTKKPVPESEICS